MASPGCESVSTIRQIIFTSITRLAVSTESRISAIQDAQQNLSFIGDDVRTVECDLGTVVSVTIQRTFIRVRPRAVSFRVNLAAGESVLIRTKGIVTIHRFSIIPAANHGRLDLYTVTKLRGTASEVAF